MNLGTVLLIESDAAFRDALGAGFSQAGYAVRLASNDAGGLREFMAVPPDVVITNITSTQDGIGNILAMKRACRRVKVVAMSGGDRMGSARCLSMATHLGADHTISKPFHVADLVACVRMMLAQPADRSDTSEDHHD